MINKNRLQRSVPQNAAEIELALRYWNRLYERRQQSVPPSRHELDQFRRYVGPRLGQRAIDVGCGRGRFTASMARMGVDATGYDWATAAIKIATGTHSSRRVRFAVHDFLSETSPEGVKPGTVDIVVCRLTLGYLDGKHFMEQASRWLRPATGTLHLVLETSERQPPGWTSLSHSEAEIETLCEGWDETQRWDISVGGALIGLALRGPQLLLGEK
ncbi:class I SAM-dependent methyltransferase [Streptomyces sp. NPDC060028]|uniref:class I SAM-dependent methyltransferase n=1 Tax=Streptomyces sp. NPDC060028 TaxID=3347041 RepID=UPI003685046A